MRQAAALEDLDLVWYEEPVLADDIAACAEVAQAIRIPVATGENNYTRYEFRELIERRAARYLMPDVCRANGFSETLKIGHLAAAHGSPSRRTSCTSSRSRSAGALSNGFLVEYMDWMPPDLFEELPECKDGQIRIPDRPGHGMALHKRTPSRNTAARAADLPGFGQHDFACRLLAFGCQFPHAPARRPVDVAALLERIARPGDGVFGFGFAGADEFLVRGADESVLHHALDDGVGDVALVAAGR